MFYHSVLSDWNHGNAHFLRGIATELWSRGHEVRLYEPTDGWSLRHMLATQGIEALEGFRAAYPHLASCFYDPRALDLDGMLADVDLVLVHEWNAQDLVRALGEHRSRHGSYALLFHDTHHRSITDRTAMAAYELGRYDGVLAFGRVLRDLFVNAGWARRAWIWHEAADVRVFRPHREIPRTEDVVWIGNWGDEERSAEIREFFVEPVRALRLAATAYGVRYPDTAKEELAAAEIAYGGWLANHAVPRVFANARITVHIPRRPYVQALPGIPTIRVFEALACGLPLVCAPWEDCEGLFTPGRDYLVAADGDDMRAKLARVLSSADLAVELAARGRDTILARHTCAHRVDELLAIYEEIGRDAPARGCSTSAIPSA